MERIKENKKNIQNYLIIISIFLYLVFAYNISLREYIYPNTIILFITLLLPIIIMGWINRKKIKELVPLMTKTFIIAFILLCVILLRNEDIINGHPGLPFYYVVTVILFLILCHSDNWIKIAINIILLFTIEHVFCTWLFYFCPDFYISYVMPLFPEMFQSDLLYQFEHGQMAGLTYHYSTNGMYLAIGLIMEFGLLLRPNLKKERKILLSILFILNLGALLLTGKRAHLLFSILAIIIMLIVKNKKQIKKSLLQIFVALIVACCLIGIGSMFLPELGNTINRIIQFSQSGDVTNGRLPLYNLALKSFEKSPIIGNGWGSYKYNYEKSNINLNNNYEQFDAHNIYLQLLSEVGILGTVFILGIFLTFLVRTIKYIVANDIENEDRYNLINSLGIQLFVLIYGITGNPLYDVQIFFIYMISLAIYSATRIKIVSTIKKPIKLNNDVDKIGVLTFHKTTNYGAELQKYALQKVLRNNDFNSEVIDYKCEAVENRELTMNLFELIKNKDFKNILKCVFRSDSQYIRTNKFRNFANEHVYTSVDSYDKTNIKKANNKYTDFIVGSDQVWNMTLTNGDYTYLLDFVDDDLKKKSYAASFGYKEIPTEYIEKNKELFNKFEVLNVREKQGKNILSKITNKEVNITIDPTLLLKEEEWDELLNNYVPYKKEYILVYLPEFSKEIFSKIRELAKREKCKIIYIHGSLRNEIGMKNLRIASPIDFLGLIKNAKYVITGSFHAICFSIIFKKEFFYTIAPMKKNNSRIEDLLKLVDLANRSINNCMDKKIEKIDYEKVSKIMEQQRNESKTILLKTVQKDRLINEL